MFIYVIVNDVTLKLYIGKTLNKNLEQYLQQKFSEAKRGISSRSRLYNSIRKYGRDHFHIYPLISDLKINEELCYWEQVLIKATASQNKEIGYNICRGGEGFTGPHTIETRRKIAAKMPAIMKGNKHSLGYKMTAEQVEALRQRNIGRKASPLSLQKLRESHLGIPRSEESKKKQSQSTAGDKNHFYGQTHSEVSHAKMKEKRATVQYHCSIHHFPIASPRSKCPVCK